MMPRGGHKLFGAARLFETSAGSLPASVGSLAQTTAAPARGHFGAAVSRLSHSQALQVAFAIAVCLYVAMLHLSNDGLWFQGDAPRHAGNGLFWWDLLTTMPLNPKEFAFSYHARYPGNNPIAYPPLFYLIEGVAFALFGRSPFVAKTLVLAMLLVAVLYTMAWLRRWVSTLTGWGAPLLALQPGMIGWSHAVMLNVPSTALAIAALYHSRRALESSTRVQSFVAAILVIATCFTYYPAGLVIPIAILWIVARRKLTWRVLLVAGGVMLALVPLIAAVSIVKPRQLAPLYLGSKASWLYFPMHASRLFDTSILALAIAGLLVAALSRRYRRETLWIISWLAIAYIGFTFLAFPDPRYLLFVAPVIVISAMMAFAVARARTIHLLRIDIAGVLLALLIGYGLVSAWYVRVPRVDGFRELASFIERVNPDRMTFYHGFYNGIFSFYLQSGDPAFQRGVVAGHSLLSGPRFKPGQTVSPDAVIDAIRKRCGCQWLVVEHGRTQRAERVPGVAHIRTALTSPDLELVRSFEISDGLGTTASVYRLRGNSSRLEEVDVNIPQFGGVQEFHRVKPFSR